MNKIFKKMFEKFGDDEWFFGVYLKWWKIIGISLFIGLILGLFLFYFIWKQT